MARNSGQPARDLFPGHNVGAGKGSKPRHTFNAAWRANFDAIEFRGIAGWNNTFQSLGFTRKPRAAHKWVKKYPALI